MDRQSKTTRPPAAPERPADRFPHDGGGELTEEALDAVVGGDSVSGNATGRRQYGPVVF